LLDVVAVVIVIISLFSYSFFLPANPSLLFVVVAGIIGHAQVTKILKDGRRNVESEYGTNSICVQQLSPARR
jgi:hypothetical protein